jgi:glycosyltransferase involved in cell wall biosynthesis
VTTTIPGCTDLVHDGSNGLLVPPKNPRALARAIRALLEDPTTRVRMGRNGRERVVSAFSTDRVISQTFQVYGDLLRNPS